MELRDNWSVSGTDFEEFKQQVRDVDSKTGMIEVKSASDMMLLSVKSKRDTNYEFYVLNDDTIEAFNSGNDVSVTQAQLNSPLFDEMAKTTGLLVFYDNVKYILSQDAIYSLGERANINGLHIAKKSFIRDLYLAEGLFPADEKIRIKMVYRKEMRKKNGKVYSVRKIFSCMGSKFFLEPLETVVSIVQSILDDHAFGHAVIRNWTINHRYCSIQVEFPEYYFAGIPDNIIPGIRIITSDVGRSALKVMSTFRVDGGEEAIHDEESWTHASDFKNIKSEVYEYIHKTFPAEFDRIPEILSKMAKARKGKSDIIFNSYGNALHLVQAIGKNRTKALLTELSEETPRINDYQAIIKLLTCHHRLDDLPYNAQLKFAKALGNIAFVNGKDVIKSWED